MNFNIESDYRFNFSVFEGIPRLQTELEKLQLGEVRRF